MFLKLVQDRISVRFLVMTAGALSIGAYMIVLPTMEMFWDSQQELPTSFVVEDPTALEVFRVRSAKLAVFAVFIFAGACLGSFVNVAATCIPQGQSFLIRSSACPKCENRIRRIDNIPVLSYLWLGGKCRFCEVPIPPRYLAVELIGMAIFGILFLFQLVNGAENIPGFPPYSHTGVVWMILYKMESHRCLRFTLWSFCVVVDLDADGAKSITATYLVHVDPIRTVRVDGL